MHICTIHRDSIDNSRCMLGLIALVGYLWSYVTQVITLAEAAALLAHCLLVRCRTMDCIRRSWQSR